MLFVRVMTFFVLSDTCVIVVVSVEGCGIGNIYSNMYCHQEQQLRCMETVCPLIYGFERELALFLRFLTALSRQLHGLCSLGEVGAGI